MEKIENAVAPNGDSRELPTYDSMTQCAARTGIPISALKLAKKQGCEAFKWNRVALGPLLQWWFSRDGDADENWGERLKMIQCRREELRLARDKREILDRDEVQQAILQAMAELFGTLDRVFCSELPPDVVGLDELGIRAKAKASIEETKKVLKERFKVMAGEEGAKESKSG